MSYLILALAAVATYFAADWIVDRIERLRKSRLTDRTALFFGIYFGLLLAAFYLIHRLRGE